MKFFKKKRVIRSIFFICFLSISWSVLQSMTLGWMLPTISRTTLGLIATLIGKLVDISHSRMQISTFLETAVEQTSCTTTINNYMPIVSPPEQSALSTVPAPSSTSFPDVQLPTESFHANTNEVANINFDAVSADINLTDQYKRPVISDNIYGKIQINENIHVHNPSGHIKFVIKLNANIQEQLNRYEATRQAVIIQKLLLEYAQKTDQMDKVHEWIQNFAENLYDLSRSGPQGALARTHILSLQAPLPLLEVGLEKFQLNLRYYLYNANGSVKINLTSSEEYNIASYCTKLIEDGVGREEAQRFLDTACARNIPGYQYAKNPSSYKYFFSRGAENVENFFKSSLLACKYQKVLTSKFNHHLNTLISLCNEGEFAQAYSLAHCSSLKKDLLPVYQEYFFKVYNRYGIAKQFESDPSAAKIMSTIAPSNVPKEEINNLLTQRAQLYKQLTNHIDDKPTSCTQQILYQLINNIMEGKGSTYEIITQCCSNQEVLHDQASYQQLFNGQGLLKILDYNQHFVKNIQIPSTIHSPACIQDKIMLNVLANYSYPSTPATHSLKMTGEGSNIPLVYQSHIEAEPSKIPHISSEQNQTSYIPNERSELPVRHSYLAEAGRDQHVTQAINYLAHGCSDSPLASDYKILAHEMYHALVDKNYDQTIMQCIDFTQHEELMAQIASIIRVRNSLPADSQEYAQLNQKLLEVNQSCTSRDINKTARPKPVERFEHSFDKNIKPTPCGTSSLLDRFSLYLENLQGIDPQTKEIILRGICHDASYIIADQLLKLLDQKKCLPQREVKPETSCNHSKNEGLFNFADAVSEDKKTENVLVPGENTQEELEKKTIEALVKESTFIEKKRSCKQYKKNGDYQQVLKDFESLNPKDVKNIPTGKLGTLDDGRIANARWDSSAQHPTLEVYNPITEKSIKIRYYEK